MTKANYIYYLTIKNMKKIYSPKELQKEMTRINKPSLPKKRWFQIVVAIIIIIVSTINF